ncbi:MAG: hypothetical protein RR454_00325 [Clostridia bacterium]
MEVFYTEKNLKNLDRIFKENENYQILKIKVYDALKKEHLRFAVATFLAKNDKKEYDEAVANFETVTAKIKQDFFNDVKILLCKTPIDMFYKYQVKYDFK